MRKSNIAFTFLLIFAVKNIPDVRWKTWPFYRTCRFQHTRTLERHSVQPQAGELGSQSVHLGLPR
jgi:hypothetical protein